MCAWFRFEDNAVKNLVKSFNESLDVAQNANSKMNTLMNQPIKVIDVIHFIPIKNKIRINCELSVFVEIRQTTIGPNERSIYWPFGVKRDEHCRLHELERRFAWHVRRN